jgi:hypothetical protein
MKEGDQLQIRAVTVDNNTMSGPDTGFSETRLLRIARKGEYDSLAIEGTPPFPDTALVTLRYIIMLTEQLEKSRRKIPHDTLKEKAADLGAQVRVVTGKVEKLNEDYTAGGLFPSSQELMTARDELYQGADELFNAEPGNALPHLWNALREIQKFLFAKRYYLRGKTKPILVDLAKVRLTGKDTGNATGRTPRPEQGGLRLQMQRDFARARMLARSFPDSAADILLALQVTALSASPQLAGELAEAATAVRAHKDASAILDRVRRALDGKATTRDSLPAWGGSW